VFKCKFISVVMMPSICTALHYNNH